MRRIVGALLVATVVVGCQQATPAPTAPDPTPVEESPGEAWSAVPLAPDPAFEVAARDLCLPEFEQDRALPLLVQDRRRSDLTAFHFEDATVAVDAVVRRLADGTFACEGGGSGSGADIRGAGLGLGAWTLIGDDRAETWLLSGYVDRRAVEVRIRRLDGVDIEASVGGGRFLAMWQGRQGLALVTASDGGQRELARIDDPLELEAIPDETLLVFAAITQDYDAAARSMTFHLRAEERGLSPQMPPGWTRTFEPPAVTWEFLGRSGEGEVFAETVEATLTVACDDLRFTADGEQLAAAVGLSYSAGRLELRKGASSSSMGAFGSWLGDLPACPATP